MTASRRRFEGKAMYVLAPSGKEAWLYRGMSVFFYLCEIIATPIQIFSTGTER